MTTFRLVVETQVRENYGAHEWDGTGACPQYWKFKGGRSVTVAEFATRPTDEQARAVLLEQWKDQRSDYCEEYMVSWSVLEPTDETEDERLDRELDEARAALEAQQQQAEEIWLQEQEEARLDAEYRAKYGDD
jgi:hypothetical protein